MSKHILLLALLLGLTSCQKILMDEGPINPDPEPDPAMIEKGKLQKTISVNGTLRNYIIHVPESYQEENEYPLLFAFHGLGGNMESSYENSQFYPLAESEGFIVVHPDGLNSNFNVVTVSNNKDVEFTRALIDQIKSEYSIDDSRIYSSGMSNGGYFSFLLACEMSDQIAAIGSVTGLMFKNVLRNCKPERQMPILQIHGTADGVVSYDNVPEVLAFWIDHNALDASPQVTDIPNTNIADGTTAKRYTYTRADGEVELQHIQIDRGGHDWPGYQGNMDISASREVWDFVKQYDINGRIK